MLIILKDVPQNTTYRQIDFFLKQVLQGGLFSKSGRIENIFVLVNKYDNQHAVAFHIIVDIQPESVAQKVVEKLNRKNLNGRHIAVNEYIERAVYEDKSYLYSNEAEKRNRLNKGLRGKHTLFRIIKIEHMGDFVWPDKPGA
jgi:hypothetical protein